MPFLNDSSVLVFERSLLVTIVARHGSKGLLPAKREIKVFVRGVEQ